MKKLLVYPYNHEMSSFCRFTNLLCNVDEVIPVAPKSVGIFDSDCSVCDGGPLIGKRVVSDFDRVLKSCDCVFMDKANDLCLSPEHYRKRLQCALQAKKDVTITQSLADYLKPFWEIPSEIKTVGFEKITSLDICEMKTYEIPVPCITFLGSGDRTNKFHLQLGITNYFKEKGYKVCTIGTKEYSELYGIHALPDMLFQTMDQTTKILNLNHYIYDLVLKEAADILLVGIPGAIMQLDPGKFTDYGELPFIMGNVLKADITVLSLYSTAYTQKAIDYLRLLCKYKLNAPVEAINIACSNMVYSQATLDSYIVTIDSDFITRKILPEMVSCGVGTYATLESDEMIKLAHFLENELLNG